MNHHHPLIKTSHNFVLDRKVLFIDSNDRDVERWPNVSEFEVNCPQIYTNVESLRLLNINLPNFFYNISEQLQTNKMWIDISGTPQIITLDDGYYKYNDLLIALQQSFQDLDPSFNVSFNLLNHRFTFTNSAKPFALRFDKINSYNKCIKDTHKIDVYAQHSKWGLGYILGFNKEKYDSSLNNSLNTIVSNSPSDLEHSECIYIELEKYNKCDEIKPFLYYNFNNSNSGILNSSFAKIPIYQTDFNKGLLNDGYLENSSYYQPPIDKISKIKLKFRYHNGMLVDFHNCNVSLSLEINQIRNEMNNYEVRTPYKL